MVDVNHAVIRNLRNVELVKALGMITPGKVAAIDDHAADTGAMAAHELGHGVHDHVGAVLDRAQQDGRGDCVVDYKWNPMFVRDASQALDVSDIAGRVADTFAIDGASVVVDERLDVLGTVCLSEARGDAALGKNV